MQRIFRMLIGFIFIVSGAVKAIDPVGFSFKLEEYFSPSVFNMPWLESFAIYIAVFVVALEMILGAMLLFGIRIKKTIYWLIAICIFFAFLTFYSAYYNKVTDCGCFGDAIKFTPWQSFAKDIVLLIALSILALSYRKHENKKISPLAMISFMVTCIAMVITMIWGIVDEPIIDFRDYKIGIDLVEERKKVANDPDVYVNIYVLKNKKSGEEKTVNQIEYLEKQEYWNEDSPWEIQSDKTYSEKIHEGYASEIKKFKIEDENGNDLTEEVLSQPKAVLIFSYAPKELAEFQRKKAIEIAQKENFVMGVSSLPQAFPMLRSGLMDATAIKTIARSNPFLLVLQKGKIIEKRKL